jgi:hypothetical protein
VSWLTQQRIQAQARATVARPFDDRVPLAQFTARLWATESREHRLVSQKFKILRAMEQQVPATPSSGKRYPGTTKGAHMRKIGLTLTAVAALATVAAVNSPAEARGGRNAGIGFGVAAGVLGAAAAANAYNNGYHYGPRYGYYGGGPYGYYDDGPRYYRRHYRYYDAW